MKILSAQQVRDWDAYTIQHEPITSINLMERAASKCVEWLTQFYPDALSFDIFCGKGNNGGDGLAIARLLLERRYHVSVHILEFGHKGTDDFQTNLERLHSWPGTNIHFIQSENNLHNIPRSHIIIDALFGTGINRELEGLTARLVEHINHTGCEIISIDMPSGLFADRSSKGVVTVKATHTLSFQCYKPAFFFAENASAIGKVHILDIGLHPDFYKNLHCRLELTDKYLIQSLYKPRNRFSHKGNFGHALLVAGSYGKMGAAVLSAKACLRSGVGLLTCHIPKCGYEILQTTVAEAMVTTDYNSSFSTKIEEDPSKFDAIGVGPGMGVASETRRMLRELFDKYQNALVLDADALNIIASQKDFFELIPQGSILTPHAREFERLFGETANEFDRVELALQKAGELKCIIVLKGHHTFIATTDGYGYFNATGNAGMATAGSGDVLTGILTGLLAQGYSAVEAAILGVYLHGLAGDLAAEDNSKEALIASDIIAKLGAAFSQLNT